MQKSKGNMPAEARVYVVQTCKLIIQASPEQLQTILTINILSINYWLPNEFDFFVGGMIMATFISPVPTTYDLYGLNLPCQLHNT